MDGKVAAWCNKKYDDYQGYAAQRRSEQPGETSSFKYRSSWKGCYLKWVWPYKSSANLNGHRVQQLKARAREAEEGAKLNDDEY